MPEISRFLGIIIAMYYNDHNPPHFHAKYGDFIGVISIETGEFLKVDYPLAYWVWYKNGVSITSQN